MNKTHWKRCTVWTFCHPSHFAWCFLCWMVTNLRNGFLQATILCTIMKIPFAILYTLLYLLFCDLPYWWGIFSYSHLSIWKHLPDSPDWPDQDTVLSFLSLANFMVIWFRVKWHLQFQYYDWFIPLSGWPTIYSLLKSNTSYTPGIVKLLRDHFSYLLIIKWEIASEPLLLKIKPE